MSEKIQLDDVGMTPFLKRVTIFASGGPFIDGYVLAIIGVALTQLTPALKLDEHWTGMVGIAALVGLFIGTSVGGYITDLVGRKRMFIIDIVAIMLISIGTMFVATPFQLVIMRFLIGVAIGADYPIATSLVAEFTPRRYRAISMGAIAAAWYLGANCAYVVGYFLQGTSGGWRFMLGSTVIPCLVILIGRWGIPESPRWLARKGRQDEAQAIVRRLFGADVALEDEVATKTEYRKLLHRPYFGRVMFIGTIWLCQAIPMFAIYTFGPIIMGAFGMGEGGTALLGEILIGTFFMIGCIPAMFWANSFGRRPLIIASFAMMAVALGVLGVLPNASVWAVVICFGIYAFFSGGPGNLQWLYPNELFPTEIRASAVGAAMAVSRIGTVVSMYGLPVALANWNTNTVMLVGAGLTVLGLVVSVLMAPETRDLTLSESSSTELRLGRRGR